MRYRFLTTPLLLLAWAGMFAPSAAQDVRNPEPVKIPTLFGTIIIGTYFPREVVGFSENLPAGSIVISTSQRRLYYVMGGGKALRYAIAVGKEGYAWAGTSTVSSKREWPSWTPPADMRKRKPELPAFMAGGKDNPLGARALYLGATVYRIHGTNRPDTIGTAVSSGCFRLVNADVTDLYERVPVGTKVIVRQKPEL